MFKKRLLNQFQQQIVEEFAEDLDWINEAKTFPLEIKYPCSTKLRIIDNLVYIMQI